MQAAEDGMGSVRSLATSSLQNCLCRSFLKGYGEEVAGLGKARGKIRRIVRRKADESCLHVRMDSESHVLNCHLLILERKIRQSCSLR